MFGYIVINKAELKFREFDIYKSYYCGLCRKLKEKYGVTGQMSLTYDMTFLVLLLTGLYDPETEESVCTCAAHPIKKHPVRTNLFTEYAADMNLLFTYYKCRDDWNDERKYDRLLYGRFLYTQKKKTEKQYGKKIRRISRLLKELSAREREEETDLDLMAGLFGRIMAELVACREDEWEKSLRKLGFYLGKYIYLLDAYEDVQEDLKKGTYNPLLQFYGQEDFEERCRGMLTMMMAECSREFEKLPILEHASILRNILYSGVWSRYEQVKEKRKGQEEKHA